MIDIVLDTNILADFLIQYLRSESKIFLVFTETEKISKELADSLNKIVKGSNYFDTSDDYSYGLITSSCFSFIEAYRQFDKIFNAQITKDQFLAFIDSPPEWFNVSAVDDIINNYLLLIPSFVSIKSRNVPIEWTDAIHVATVLSRGESCKLATTDGKLKSLYLLRNKLI
jgi:hypothetical protein